MNGDDVCHEFDLNNDPSRVQDPDALRFDMKGLSAQVVSEAGVG